MSPLLSIIVPVYNTIEYIDECINSILDQEFTDFELIIIDDCSSDGSSNRIDEWSKNDNRIVPIHKNQNKGVSDSRNLGLSIAKGKYIAFVDSDDYVEKNMYNKMIDLLEKSGADIAFGGYNKVTENKVTRVIPFYSNGQIISSEEALSYCIAPMHERSSDVFIWDKLYRKASLYIDGQMYLMDTRFSYCEDMYWLVHILLNVNTIVCWNDCGYNYRNLREGNTWSEINKFNNMKYCISALKTNTAIWRLLREHNSQSTNSAFQRVLFYMSYSITTSINRKDWKCYKKVSKGYVTGLIKWALHNKTTNGIIWSIKNIINHFMICVKHMTFLHL